ncbi:MAG: SDR family oxidoreductase [Gammaproteobacteria bacterium]|nr:SDR family oxidoreductase [Gammaproteobacteria bacterium]
MNILLTGATGFLGRQLVKALVDMVGVNVTAAVRRSTNCLPSRTFEAGGLGAETDWSQALLEQNVVVHAAARAHIMRDEVAEPLAEYRTVNVAGSENLARQAAAAGVKRFIYISSVKVLGESTSGETAFNELTAADPEDAYGQSKYEAEEVLKKIASETGMELVIIRPPLVYGPGVKANFLSLLKLCQLSLPLPFGLVNNRRSMVYLDNLVDFTIQCIDHPNAANQTFLVSDGQDLSLSNLIRIIRKAMNKPAWLLPVPVSLFKLVGKLTGKMALVDRLIGDFQVDSSKAQQLLGWTPPYTVEQGIVETVKDFMNRKN